MSEQTTFSAFAFSHPLELSEKILDQLGLRPGDAFNIVLAQVECAKVHGSLSTEMKPLLSPEAQAQSWVDAFGEY